MDLPQGVTEVIVDSVAIENDRGTIWLVTRCVVSQGDHVGKHVVVREPVSGVCGKVEFETE